MNKKILFVGSFPPPFHGSSVYFQNLINHPVLNSKFEVITLNTGDPRHDLDNLGKLDYINAKTAIKNLFEFYKICKEKKPDLVYINTPQGIAYVREGFFILISKIFFNLKIIQHLHGSEFLNFYGRAGMFMKYFVNLTQKKIEYSIVLSDNIKYIFKRWQKPENIFSVPNGIRPEVNYKSRNIDGRLPVLFFFSNLLKFKGLMLTLEVLEIIKKDYPGIMLNIAGGWGYDWYYELHQDKVKDEFYKIIEEKKLKDNIVFKGPVDDKRKSDLLEESDILIYPTQMYGFPIVILEAMSAGCPVITAKMVGAIPEVVMNGETGFLISDYNSERYAEALKKIIESPELFSRMSVKSRKRFDEKYTLEKNVENISSTFDKILNE